MRRGFKTRFACITWLRKLNDAVGAVIGAVLFSPDRTANYVVQVACLFSINNFRMKTTTTPTSSTRTSSMCSLSLAKTWRLLQSSGLPLTGNYVGRYEYNS